jgi:signal transduction histidine kinase
VPVSLDVRLHERLPTAVEVAAYFVVSEALVNVQKHADAKHARVHLRIQDGDLIVEIADDGRGGASLGGGTGLSGLRDRIAALDGTLVVTSPAGGPTIVRAEIPCGS